MQLRRVLPEMHTLGYDRERALFAASLELREGDRDAFLQRECAGNTDLLARLRRLLKAHERASESRLLPPVESPRTWDLESIRGYHLLEVLGEGGMGIVYAAEQFEPVRRRVALKIIKLGMETRETLSRFMTEKQALAAMNHPSIARVFDAGQTAAGRPYFVMELVEGKPLLEYCDTYRLSICKRVELLVQVCEAVQHAHQKGVLHRDLKPSNILVSSTPSGPLPRIIDFGIARAVGPELADAGTRYTRAGQTLGTPAYMSPEQAGFGAIDIDTRTDVYSLGVILCEVLTGCLPLDPAELGYTQFLALLAKGELLPVRPSLRLGRLPNIADLAGLRSTAPRALMRQLNGDPDWIVMKALEVDRCRRYESVQELAEDLRRYLRGAPVSAHPPTVRYRAKKFVRRYRVQVLAASATALALVSGTVAASVGLVRATRAEAAARQEAAAARQVSDFLVQLFTLSNNRGAPGNPATVRELLERGASRVEKELKGQPAVQAKLFGTLSEVYDALGQYEEAKNFALKSLALPQAPGAEGELQTAAALLQLGRINQRLGDMQEARRLLRRSLEIRLRVLGEDHLDVARVLNAIGYLDGLTERYDEATRAHERALAIQRRVGGAFHLDAARSVRGLAIIEDRKHNTEAGLQLFRNALEIYERNYGPEHPFVASALQDVAVSLKDLNRPRDAQLLLERSLSILRRADGPDHPQVSFTEHSLALALIAQGKLQEALPYLEHAYRIRTASMGSGSPRTGDIAESLGNLWVSLGQPEKGRVLLEQALRVHERSYGPDHFATRETRRYFASVLVKTKRYGEAVAQLRHLSGPNVPERFRVNLNDAQFQPLRDLPSFRRLQEEALSR